MKKIIFNIFAVLILSIVILTGCSKKEDEAKFTIIATSFPGYDFARAITKESSDISTKMLLKPGAETHDYEPTPKDIKDIKNSDMFIYVGGESDAWITNLLSDIDTSKTKIIKLMDLVEVVSEEYIEGMETIDDNHDNSDEYDEHVWTSPINAIKIIEKLKNEISSINDEEKQLYEKNSENYINEIKQIDNNIRSMVSTSKRKELIFGDRFPLRYFVLEYGLSYYAAFPGCSDATEVSAKTLAFLINKVKEDNIPVVFHIELSNGNIAKAISKETGTKILEFNSVHNISQEDFDAGKTYVDFMKNNIEVLNTALNS